MFTNLYNTIHVFVTETPLQFGAFVCNQEQDQQERIQALL
jgi:hypothetical protein